jgi:hypothetical protein
VTDEEDKQPDLRMSTTQVMQITEDLREALSPDQLGGDAPESPVPSADLTQTKLPAKVVAALILWVVTQVLAVSGVYYDLRGEVRSLQQSFEVIEEVVVHKDLDTIRMELGNLKEAMDDIEKDLETPPTNIDHMRVIGDMKTDIRVLEQRVTALERAVK